jgi:hypothetical protein
VEEFNQIDEYVLQFSAGWNPIGVAFDAEGDVWSDNQDASGAIEEHNENGKLIQRFATRGSGNGQVREPKRLTVVKGYVWVPDGGNNRVEIFTETGEYVTQFGGFGTGSKQMNYPTSVTIDPRGNVWITDNNNRVDQWKEAPGHADVPDTQTIYYSAKEEAAVAACRNHPEWAGLVCQAQPTEQPSDSPKLPVTSVTYNMWDEAETTKETFGTGSDAVTRTKTETYDTAGRAVTSEETASPAADKPLPKVTDEYNSETGALEKQATSEGTITSKYNTLGQMVEYTDAGGNVAEYTYEEGRDGRLEEVSEGKGEEAYSSETYSYNATTGLMEKLVYSGEGSSPTAGTFTASYDVEGNLISQIYPNGMCENTTYNPVGQAISLEYIKTRNCSETGAPVWFHDSVVPSIHGETVEQQSTLSEERYGYDNVGRLVETKETPAGKGCSVRLYAYDEEGNRLSQTTREPGSEGACASEGGTVQRHSYDEANRLVDEGVEYETFGNITKLPAGDAGTGESAQELNSSYYVDGQIATQEQNEEMIAYAYDPEGRTASAETVVKGKLESTAISHYAGPGAALTWTSEGSSLATHNIPGIGGALDGIQTAGGSPVLQLHDLQGNIVGTAEDNENATELLSTYNSTEFGVPSTSSPPKYSWLGAGGLESELTASGITTEGGASYVPQVARDLQSAPIVPPGAFPNGQPGTQLTAVPGVWTPTDQAEASDATEMLEAERQKAREEEARRACEADPIGCGESVDPVIHYREWEAQEKGEKLLHLADSGNEADTLGTIGDAIGQAIEGGGVFAFFGGKNVVEVWAEKFGELLIFCVGKLHSTHHYHGGCRASIKDIVPFGWDTGIPNFWDIPEVSFCLGMSSDTKRVHWCYLEVFASDPFHEPPQI